MYNSKVSKDKEIPEGYFDFIKDQHTHRGQFIEKLAQYGDPSEFSLPIGLKSDINADMSFTGAQTAIASKVSLNMV